MGETGFTLRWVSSLDRVLRYARQRDFRGFSKFDALNAPLLERLLAHTRWGRTVAVQVVNRSPLDLRSLLGVVPSRNPKGIANFAKAYANRHEALGDPDDLARARALADWLLANHSNRDGAYRGLCWGYNFPWPNPGFYAPRGFPNCILTVFGAEALLRVAQMTGEDRYLAGAESAARYVLEDLPVLDETVDTKCIGYVTAPLDMRVININAVSGGFLGKLYRATGNGRYRDEASKLVAWAVGRRTGDGCWHYTDPPTPWVRNHDNYHTGGILDGIFDYMDGTGDLRFMDAYLQGLTFYERELFTRGGAPKWRNTKRYPHDVHGSAQGILTFCRAARWNPAHLDTARKLAGWAIEHLQGPEGGFWYQVHRYHTRKDRLMRWNNSWMAWALSELVLGERPAPLEQR